MSQSVTVESPESTPAIQRIPFGTDRDQVVEIVNRDGGVILTGVLTLDEVDAVNHELEPWVESHAGSATANVLAKVHSINREKKDHTGYEGSNTRHLQHCVKRSKTYRDKILASEIRQNLHRDSSTHHAPYIGLGNDGRLPNVLCNTLLALTESTEEMGATRVIPRSGHWDDFSVRGSQDQTIPVAMQPGEMFFYDGKTLHAGGANSTDRTRRMLSTAFTLPYVMGEEAWPFAISLDQVRTYPKRVQVMLGFSSISTRGETPGFFWRVDTRPLEEHLTLKP